MKSTVKQSMVARTTILSLLFLFALLGMVPLPVALGPLEGMLPLFPSFIILFYFSVFLPEALPFWAVFLIGLIDDVVLSLPLGVLAFVYICFYILLVTQRRFFTRKPYSVLLAGFAFSTLIAACMIAALLLLVFHHPINVGALAFEWAVAVGLYSLFHWPLSELHYYLIGGKTAGYGF
jgi:rod shape-determining protein MreD